MVCTPIPKRVTGEWLSAVLSNGGTPTAWSSVTGVNARSTGLHGPSWCDPVWRDLPGIACARPDEASAQGLGEVVRMSADIALSKLGDRMRPGDRETFSTAMDSVTLWLLAERERFALLHGDYRLDNMWLNEYHRTLSCHGIADYDRETFWRDYRLGMPHALLISALGFAFGTATDRGDDMVLTMLQRGCQAIRDLGTLQLIG